MGESSSAKADTIGQDVEEETVQWTIFAGLDISMDETHVCVLDREGAVVYESKTELTAQAIANELAKAPSCVVGSCSRQDELRRSCSIG